MSAGRWVAALLVGGCVIGGALAVYRTRHPEGVPAYHIPGPNGTRIGVTKEADDTVYNAALHILESQGQGPNVTDMEWNDALFRAAFMLDTDKSGTVSKKEANGYRKNFK